MSLPLTVPPAQGHRTFLYSEPVTDLDDLHADIAFIGMPYGNAYTPAAIINDQSCAPDRIRAISDRVSRNLERYDFDVGGPIYDGRNIRAVDVGNVPFDLNDHKGHFARAEQVVRKVLAAGAMPITLGGDHGIPIPIFRALDCFSDVTIIHIDAHLDWRDDVDGVRDGLSSPIRRASEMDHIGQIFQIGLRSQGSGRPAEAEAAQKYGSHIFTAYDVHDHGMQAVLDKIPNNGKYYITIDADGLDPSVMPAVEGPAPGGLLFTQVRTLIHGLVGKGRVLGMDIVEITPSRDINNISCITAGRLIVNLIGAAVRANYFPARQEAA